MDADPVVIEINAQAASRIGVEFRRLGEHLFLCGELAPHVLHLPPPPKEKQEDQDRVKAKPVLSIRPFMPSEDDMPGSFSLRMPEEREEERRDRSKRKKDRQKGRKASRRLKREQY